MNNTNISKKNEKTKLQLTTYNKNCLILA